MNHHNCLYCCAMLIPRYTGNASICTSHQQKVTGAAVRPPRTPSPPAGAPRLDTEAGGENLHRGWMLSSQCCKQIHCLRLSWGSLASDGQMECFSLPIISKEKKKHFAPCYPCWKILIDTQDAMRVCTQASTDVTSAHPRSVGF